MQQSGIFIPGDGKSLARLQLKDGSKIVVAGQNRGTLQAYKQEQTTGKSIVLQRNDCVAIIKLKDGRTYREELPYGNSFLSQSARRLWLPTDAVSVEVIDYQGKVRSLQSDSSQVPR